MNAYIVSQIPTALGVASLLIVSSLRRPKVDRDSFIITIAALLGSLYYTAQMRGGGEFFGGAIRVTQGGQILACVILVLFLFSAVASHGYAVKVGVDPTDWRLVMLLMSAGAVHMVLAGDFGTLFVAFELVSIPSYALAGFSRNDERSIEAGMKYLILGLVGSALFMAGLVYLYGAVGTIDLAAASEKVAGIMSKPGGSEDAKLIRISAAMLAASLFFKTAVAPLHGWLLDVYQGSSLLALSVIAAPAKLASFGLLGILFGGVFKSAREIWIPIFLTGAIACFLVGGFHGVVQKNVKRIIAASSIMNAGFILMAVVFASPAIFVLYLGAYGIATSALLCALMYFGTQNSDVDNVDDLAGLGRRSLPMGLAATILLFSLAGLPATAGFLAKFGVITGALGSMSGAPGGFSSSVQAMGAVAAVIGALSAVLSFAFYFRMVRVMWFPPAEQSYEERPLDSRWNYALPAAIGGALVLILGTMPDVLTVFGR